MRPKGGPDQGRDIEAVYEGKTTVWGAIGFQNGGGQDNNSRNEIAKKFRSDLNRALEVNSTLPGFVFFTNVDLTPGGKEELVKYAHGKNVTFVDIFDMERLLHILDSSEGLIARLQYLEIPMSPTEQAALVGKFGNQLQQAVTARFDRVERTLTQMELFLNFQKPIIRLDLFIELNDQQTSATLGDEVVLLMIQGLHDLSGRSYFLFLNQQNHSKANTHIITVTHLWSDDSPHEVLNLGAAIGHPNVITALNEVSLSRVGNPVRIADLTIISVEAFCTEGLRNKVKSIYADVNGYELFHHLPEGQRAITNLQWPESISPYTSSKKWQMLLPLKRHNYLFTPPKPSGRLLPLHQMPVEITEIQE